jgi:excisionase family DNA binding protein
MNLLTTAQFAAKLGVTPRYITLLVSQKKIIPVTRLKNSHYLFSYESLESYIKVRKELSDAK